MCDPLSGAVLAATAAGTLLSSIGQEESAAASNKARQQDNDQYAQMVQQGIDKQNAFSAQKYQQLDKTVSNESLAQQQQQHSDISNNLATQYNSNPVIDPSKTIPGLTSNLPGQSGSSGAQVINNAFGSTQKNTGNYLQQQADSKADLDAWGDLNTNTQIFNQNQGNNIGIIQDLQAGQNSALNTELGLQNIKTQEDQQDAQRAGSGLSVFGTLLSGAGTAGSKFASF